MIPVVMDIFDFFTMVFWMTKLGVTGVIGGVELIPVFGDLLPMNILCGYLADRKAEGKEVKL